MGLEVILIVMQVAKRRTPEAHEEAEAAQRMLQQKMVDCTDVKAKMVCLLGVNGETINGLLMHNLLYRFRTKMEKQSTSSVL